MATRKEVLAKELEPEVAGAAIKHCYDYNDLGWLDLPAENLNAKDLLRSGFVWSNTEEGHEYWDRIVNPQYY